MMLLDVNRERSSSLVLEEDGNSQESSSKLDLSSIPRVNLAKIGIHTLSTFQGFGSAHYKMSVLKQTTGSEAFSALPDLKKKCSLENRELCEERLWLNHLRNNCKCQPFSLAVLKIKVTSKPLVKCAGSAMVRTKRNDVRSIVEFLPMSCLLQWILWGCGSS